MAQYNVTLSIAHDPLTWRETRWYEEFKFTFRTFAEVQAFAKEKSEDRKLRGCGGHMIYVIPERNDGTFGRMMMWKYANWPKLATGDYSNMDEELHNN
jgi:hypothetical protein